MTVKVQVVFYSMYGHIYRMAEAVAEGAREVDGAEVALYQVPELMPEEMLERSGAKAARAAFAHVPIAQPAQLAEADAILFGTPTRFGICARRCATSWIRPADCGQRRSDRQGGRRLRGQRHTTRRPGEHAAELPHHAAASRHGRSWRSLQRTPPDYRERDHGRLALRCDHHHGGDGKRLPRRTNWRSRASRPPRRRHRPPPDRREVGSQLG